MDYRLHLQFMDSCIFILIFMYLRRANFKCFSSYHGISLVDFFSPARTANLNISFKDVESTFYHLRRVNFKISEDLMKMRLINGLYLIICPDLSIWSLTLDVDNKVITGGGTTLTEYWGDLKLWDTYNPLVYHGSLLKQQCLILCRLVGYQSFRFLSGCEISLSGMVCVMEGKSQFMIKLLVWKKKKWW